MSACMLLPRPEMRTTTRFLVMILDRRRPRGRCPWGRRSPPRSKGAAARSCGLQPADLERALACGAECRDHLVGVRGRDHQDHADAEVERAAHVIFGDAA